MATSFPIMIYAEDGHVVCVNRAWTNISGYTREQIPTVTAWLDRAFGARSAAIHARVASLFDMDEASGENELTLTTASGAERTWVFSSARLGRDAAGRRLLVTIAYDITERKRAGDAWEATLREATSAKTLSWRCWRTSCAIRSGPSAMRWRSRVEHRGRSAAAPLRRACERRSSGQVAHMGPAGGRPARRVARGARRGSS